MNGLVAGGCGLLLKPLTHLGSQWPNQPDNFDEIFRVRAYLGKYLKEKC